MQQTWALRKWRSPAPARACQNSLGSWPGIFAMSLTQRHWLRSSIISTGSFSPLFALCHLLGCRFAPRIRDLADKRLYVPGKAGQWSSLSPLIGGSINARLIERQLGEVLRLAASIQQGTVTAFLILRKLGSYPRQNSLALALREIGRIERTFSPWPGSKILHCAAASLPGPIRARQEIHLRRPSSSTAWDKSGIAPLTTNAIARGTQSRCCCNCALEYGLSRTGRGCAGKISGC